MSITRWTAGGRRRGGRRSAGARASTTRCRTTSAPALLLWANWQVCTIIGILIGSAVPDSLPARLRGAARVPRAPRARHQLDAGRRGRRVVGGLVALLADEAGAGHLGVLFGALGGIAAGACAEAAIDRRGPRDETPLPPDPGVVP